MNVVNQLSKVEIINETVEYYKNNHRSISDDEDGLSCLYNGPNGALCAFARVIIEEDRPNLIEGESASYLLRTQKCTFLPQYLSVGNDEIFWDEIQQLHDRSEHWRPTDNGYSELTEIGLNFVKKLKKQYNA